MSLDFCAAMSKLLDPNEPPAWYESDLQLAAALGKKLLENNLELEETIRFKEDRIQQLEYDLLDSTRKHSKSLQQTNNDHNQMLEQLENVISELEADKATLQLEKLETNKKNQNLREDVEFWQQQYQSLQEKTEQLTLELLKRAKSTEVEKFCRKFNDDEVDPKPENEHDKKIINMRCEELLCETEDNTAELEKNIHDLEWRFKEEQKRCGNLQIEIEQISMEKQFLEEQLTVIKEEQQRAKSLESELSEADPKERECPNCRLKCNSLSSNMEFQLGSSNELVSSTPISSSYKQNEDSIELYGSQESLCSADRMSEEINNNKHRLVKQPSLLNELLHHIEAENITCISNSPVREFAIQCIESVNEDEARKVANSSFYTDLFNNFEDKNNVANKCSTTAAVQTDDESVCCELEPLENPFRDRFHKTPEYKSLFQEIYAVLKRKVGGVVTNKKENIPLEIL